jgi:hypothetical protein
MPDRVRLGAINLTTQALRSKQAILLAPDAAISVLRVLGGVAQ